MGAPAGDLPGAARRGCDEDRARRLEPAAMVTTDPVMTTVLTMLDRGSSAGDLVGSVGAARCRVAEERADPPKALSRVRYDDGCNGLRHNDGSNDVGSGARHNGGSSDDGWVSAESGALRDEGEMRIGSNRRRCARRSSPVSGFVMTMVLTMLDRGSSAGDLFGSVGAARCRVAEERADPPKALSRVRYDDGCNGLRHNDGSNDVGSGCG